MFSRQLNQAYVARMQVAQGSDKRNVLLVMSPFVELFTQLVFAGNNLHSNPS
jgi:hypothetical protein